MRKITVAIVGVLIASAAHGASALAADLLSVEDAVFARHVDRSTKEYSGPVGGNFTEAPPLFFWTRIKGGHAAFRLLVEKKKLPIVHLWERRVGGDRINDTHLAASELDALEVVFRESINTDIDDQRVLEAFGIEVNALGEFDFRTWTKKENLRGGIYVVRITYQDGEPVLCSGRPCTFSICRNAAWCGD